MIFLTVGTLMPFDRLVKAMDDMVGSGAITERVVAQTGHGTYTPRHMTFARFMSVAEYDAAFAEASMLVGHAGAGTIAMALERCKPMLAVPRLHKFGEHVNDHQVATARKYAELGHVLAAYDMDAIPAMLPELARFVPRRREVRTRELAQRIGRFLEDAGGRRRAADAPAPRRLQIDH